ncbi:MAG: short-chain dehydrogenase Adh 1 [Actinomycetia bacterium]|nr:short-chain dehydrogenase Adh 1 [Actinomycetes bacterium]
MTASARATEGERVSSVEGKRVLITGGSSGIGAAIARDLAGAGAVVGICARRTALLDAVLEECRAWSPDSRAWTVDLDDLDGIESFARTVEADFGLPDVLVNNAGVATSVPLPRITFDEVESLMRLNYLSPVRLSLAFIPAMVARGSGQILNVSSVAARVSPPTQGTYGATKAALTAFFESAAADLWGTGVTVHNVYPGLITVNDVEPDALHEGMTGLPASDVAEAVRHQLEAGTFEIYVPEEFKVTYARRAKDVGAFVEASGAYASRQLGDDLRAT